MKLRDHYDWIVLGEKPAALLTASLAARLGLSVLVLPLAPVMGFSASRSGQCFDPESNSIVGLGKSSHGSLLGNTLAKIGALPSEEFDRNTVSRVPQFLVPDTRVAFFSDEDVLKAELQREFGTEAGAALNILKIIETKFNSYWHKFPTYLSIQKQKRVKGEGPRTLAELRKHLKKRIKASNSKAYSNLDKNISDMRVGIEGDFLSLATGLQYWVTSGASSEPKVFDSLHMWSLARTSGSFKGGMTAYREFLLSLARRLGVHVPIKTECRRIFIEQGRFAGVQIANFGNMISSHAGILGCPLDKAYPSITYTGRHWFHRKRKGPAKVGWKYTLALTVRKEAIPKGMLSRLIWQEPGAPALEIEVVNPTDYKADYRITNTDHRIIYLRTVMPYTDESLTIEYQRLISARMVQKVTEIIPFLEYHINQIYPDFRKAGQQKVLFHLPQKASEPQKENEREHGLELQELYGFSSLEMIPSNLLVFDNDSKGIGFKAGIEGLYVASDESYPHLGEFGATVAAFEAIAALGDRLGLPEVFV